MLSKKNIRLIMILMGLTLSIFSNVYGYDWMFYGENELAKHYYDKNSITYPFNYKSIVRVWEETIYNQNMRAVYMFDLDDRGIRKGELSEKELDNLAKVIDHLEIDCKEMKYGYIHNILYDKNGKKLYDKSYSPIQMNRSVRDDEIIERLCKNICNF